MKNFIKTIGLTFHSGDFYQKVKDEKAGDGVLFLLKMSVFLGICVGILGSIALLAFSPMIKKEVSKFVENNFPSDLVVTVKDGKMITNTNEPFLVKMPSGGKKDISKENMFAILPNEQLDVSVLSKYNTLFAMTSEGFVAEKDNGVEVRVYKYGKSNFVASKEIALKMISEIFPSFLVFALVGIIIFGIFFVFFGIFSHLIWLFLVALLIWGFLRLKKLDISYEQSYKIGMYAIVPLLFIEIIAVPLNLSGRFFTIAIIMAVVLFVTKNWKREIVENKIEVMEEKSI